MKKLKGNSLLQQMANTLLDHYNETGFCLIPFCKCDHSEGSIDTGRPNQHHQSCPLDAYINTMFLLNPEAQELKDIIDHDSLR